MFALHQQAARVVGEVAEPRVELAFAQEQAVVVAAAKEQAMAAVVGSTLCLLLYYSNRRDKLAESFVAALLEAEEHLAKRAVQALAHK